MDSAYDWKQFYTSERSGIGNEAMLAMVNDAMPLSIANDGAIVIPHTRFEVTGGMVARAVATVLESGADQVLALGVLHGARRSDRTQVELAKNGDQTARKALRGVHYETGLASEEFSLDAFVELLDLTSARLERRIEVVRAYPFFVGDNPGSLPGIRPLERLVESGYLIVATTDPIHHGQVYGTPKSELRGTSELGTMAEARRSIDEQFLALSEHRFSDFAGLVERRRSDFRDTGPVIAHLLGSGFSWQIDELALVDYAEILNSVAPTWVAGALAKVDRHR